MMYVIVGVVFAFVGFAFGVVIGDNHAKSEALKKRIEENNNKYKDGIKPVDKNIKYGGF